MTHRCLYFVHHIDVAVNLHDDLAAYMQTKSALWLAANLMIHISANDIKKKTKQFCDKG